MSAVRCTLPNGYTIEDGVPGTEGYAYYNLGPGTPKAPSSNRVPVDVMTRWLKANAKLRYVVNRSIYIER